MSASAARALTQMDTNTAGTPVNRNNYGMANRLLAQCMKTVSGEMPFTPADDGEGPQVVLVREEGHEDEAV